MVVYDRDHRCCCCYPYPSGKERNDDDDDKKKGRGSEQGDGGDDLESVSVVGDDEVVEKDELSDLVVMMAILI